MKIIYPQSNVFVHIGLWFVFTVYLFFIVASLLMNVLQ